MWMISRNGLVGCGRLGAGTDAGATTTLLVCQMWTEFEFSYTLVTYICSNSQQQLNCVLCMLVVDVDKLHSRVLFHVTACKMQQFP